MEKAPAALDLNVLLAAVLKPQGPTAAKLLTLYVGGVDLYTPDYVGEEFQSLSTASSLFLQAAPELSPSQTLPQSPPSHPIHHATISSCHVNIYIPALRLPGMFLYIPCRNINAEEV